MSLDNLKSAFDSRITTAMNNYKNNIVSPLGSNVLCEFILGSDTGNFITGADRVMDEMGSMLTDANRDLWDTFAQQHSTASHWEKVIKRVNGRIIRNKTISWGTQARSSVIIQGSRAGQVSNPPAGVYLAPGYTTNRLFLPLLIWAPNTAGIDTKIDRMWEQWTLAVWNEWVGESFGGAVPQGQMLIDPSQLGTAIGLSATTVIQRMGTRGAQRQQKAITAFRTPLKKEHDPNTTEAMFALEDIKRANPTISSAGVQLKILDIAKYIEENITADWQQTTAKRGFTKYHISNYVKLHMGPNPPNLRTDLGNIKIRAEEFIYDQLAESMGKYKPHGGGSDPMTDPRFVASKPISKQVAEDVINDLVNSAIKAKTVKKKRQTAQKFKPGTRKANLKKGRPTRATVRNKALQSKKGRAIRSRRGTAQGTGRSQENLIKLRAKIQRSLPAEVRRNMGKDGRLHNRTGRFSNSAQLLNLRDTAGGISGEYTYQKFPYQTFEPGFAQGKDRWDPRKLITMSIRNLALRHTETRFTQLRRI